MPETSASPTGLIKKAEHAPPFLVCLAKLLQLQGQSISLKALQAGLPIDGQLDPSECLRAVERFNTRASLVRRQKIAQIEPLTLPCILLLKDGRSCILTKIDGTSAEVIFPELPKVPEVVEVAELQESFDGYVAYCKPTKRLDARASKLKLASTKRWFWGTILQFWPIYKHVGFATIFVNLLALASPLFVMNVYDRVVPNNAIDTLWVLAVGVLIAYGFDFLLKTLRGYFVDTAGRSADILISSKLMQQLMSMRLDQKSASTGSLASNIREFETLREFFSSTTLLALLDLPFIALFIVIIWYVGGPVATVPAVAVPIVLLVGFGIQIPFRRSVESGFKESTQKNSMLIEIIRNLETIKTTLSEGAIQKRWEDIVSLHAKSSSHTQMLVGLSVNFTMLTAHIVSVGIIVWGVYRIAEGEMTMGGLIACNILAGRAMAPLNSIASMLTRLQRSRMSLKALDVLMTSANERPEGQSQFAHEIVDHTITFENVSFQYPETERLALSDATFTINPGEKVGIIGKIGGGKSTIGRLILRLYEPQKGTIAIGGIDVRHIDPADLRSTIGYVPQEARLFYGTVRENLMFGNPHLDDDTLYRIAKLTGLDTFIKAQPAGLEAHVGEGGSNLSGGQRQLVVVTRALLKSPEVLVLDEPTSSLDSFTEQNLKNVLREHYSDTTLVLITHRQKMLSVVDRLIVVDNGKIAAFGPKDEVLAALREGRIRT